MCIKKWKRKWKWNKTWACLDEDGTFIWTQAQVTVRILWLRKCNFLIGCLDYLWPLLWQLIPDPLLPPHTFPPHCAKVRARDFYGGIIWLAAGKTELRLILRQCLSCLLSLSFSLFFLSLSRDLWQPEEQLEVHFTSQFAGSSSWMTFISVLIEFSAHSLIPSVLRPPLELCFVRKSTKIDFLLSIEVYVLLM